MSCGVLLAVSLEATKQSIICVAPAVFVDGDATFLPSARSCIELPAVKWPLASDCSSLLIKLGMNWRRYSELHDA